MVDSPAEEPLLETPLHGLHLTHGARMTGFAGYSLPVQYAGGIRHEHLHTRAQAGLFDVSHMGQVEIEADADALEALVPGDVAGLGVWRQRYTLLTDDDGGIVDDLMLTRLPQRFFAVVNAAFKHTDVARIAAAVGQSAVRLLDDRALLALQGPQAAAVLAGLGAALDDVPFLAAREVELDGRPCLLHRCGYTGEDGFELSVAAADAAPLAERLLDDPRVEPVGLGARDSLRLEAGLCLSGTDIGSDTTPAAADLGWTVARKYRAGDAVARFPGAARILAELAEGAGRRRVGLRPRGRAPVRGGAVLVDGSGSELGNITSGSFGPSVGHPIAMGYVDARAAQAGSVLETMLRGRAQTLDVVPLPFVPHRYYRP